MRHDAKGMQRASDCGTIGGTKPADNARNLPASRETGATLAIYADERNPRLKHRKCKQAKLADTPGPKGKMPAWLSEGADQDDATAHPVYRGQLRVATTPSVGTGELPHRFAMLRGAKLPARGREDGGGVVAQRQGVMPWTR